MRNENDILTDFAPLNSSLLMESIGENADQNAVTSLASLYLNLALLMNATKGKTQKEIKDAIAKDCSVETFNGAMKDWQQDLTKQFKSGRVHVANGLVLDSSVSKINENFRNVLHENYKAEILLGAGTESKASSKAEERTELLNLINTWTNQNTNGMIPELLTELPDDFKFCLLNAIAFEARWETPYEPFEVVPNRRFRNADGSTSMVTMLESWEEDFVENKYFAGFIKPYKGDKYSLMCLLPKYDQDYSRAKLLMKPDLKNRRKFLEAALQNTDLRTLFHSATRDYDVQVMMPEFEVESSLELSKWLKAQGMETMFSDKANFSGIVEDGKVKGENLQVDSILQKAKIKVDHTGTKAGALTAALCVGAGVLDFERERRIVLLDQPFIYAVMENQTGIPVFTGMVNQL